VYVSDDKIIFHESIPGVPTAPLALGAPITYVTHRVSSLKPIAMKYQLATEHMRQAGYKDIGPTEIQDMVMAVAMEEAVPAWRKQVCVGVFACVLLLLIQALKEYSPTSTGMGKERLLQVPVLQRTLRG
jgi:hypothetical protein